VGEIEVGEDGGERIDLVRDAGGEQARPTPSAR
jgi:hypothetical protein